MMKMERLKFFLMVFCLFVAGAGYEITGKMRRGGK